MTEQKHLKALIRARMSRTGESYTAARRHIVKPDARPSLAPLVAFRAHDKHCMTVVFTPDDRQIVSGGFGGQARIWAMDGTLAGELNGHESSVNAVRISRDGTLAVTAASDRTVRLWDFAARREIGVLGRHRRQVLALDLDRAGSRVWSGGHDGKLQSWSVPTREPHVSIELGGTVTAVAVRAHDGQVAAATAGSGVAIVTSDGIEARRLAADGAAPVGSLAWAPGGDFLVASSREGATMWASDTWEPVRRLGNGSGSMLPVALNRDGTRVAVGWDHHVGLWSADESQPEVVVDGLPKGVYGLSFSGDGRLLAAAAADGRVRVWSVT